MGRSSIRSARYLLASGKIADRVPRCSVALNVALALSALIPHLSDNTSGVTLGCRSLDSNVLRVGISRDRGSYFVIVGLVSIVRYPIMDPNFLIQNRQTLDLHWLVIFRIHPHSSKSQPEIVELVEDSMTPCSSSQSFCNFPTLEKLVLAFETLLSLPSFG